jgi:hypothetical protein
MNIVMFNVLRNMQVAGRPKWLLVLAVEVEVGKLANKAGAFIQ